MTAVCSEASVQGNLKLEFPSQGWRQFLTSRKEMLDNFDRAKEKAKSHEVEVYHGKVAEAEFRKWLLDFLPKRYGVTSGYIISPGLKGTEKIPHFDVVIYDRLESPVLWIEDSPDVSPQGRSLAIPVEFVRSVIEVKASFCSTAMNRALEHLSELAPMLTGLDQEHETYKLYLSRHFSCGVVFFDLKNKYQFDRAALNKSVEGRSLRGFFGGVILRGEHHGPQQLTGRILPLRSETTFSSTLSKDKVSLFNSTLSDSVAGGERLHFGAMLMWSKSNFSQFAFDLIAMMQGTFRAGRLSSLHGLVGIDSVIEPDSEGATDAL